MSSADLKFSILIYEGSEVITLTTNRMLYIKLASIIPDSSYLTIFQASLNSALLLIASNPELLVLAYKQLQDKHTGDIADKLILHIKNCIE